MPCPRLLGPHKPAICPLLLTYAAFLSAASGTAFLKRAYELFPPGPDRKYMLDMWDHGGGWTGFGQDTDGSESCKPGGDCWMTMAELSEELQQGLAGKPKLDIIGYDACLMSSWEVGAFMTPFARYMLSSELLEPGHGWDYNFLRMIIKSPTRNINEYAFTESIMDFYAMHSEDER